MTHYLDVKDPTFVRDLELSDVHVGRLVDKLNERMKQADFASCLPGEIVGLKMVKADLVVRKSAAQRKSCSDKGDVVVSWTRHGKTESAIIEVKERRGQRFSRLEEFKFASMFVDTASKFDKIVKRGDTLGYLLTSANHECIFGVGLGVMRKHSRTTLQKNFRWATNMVELAKEHFTEGIDQVCNMVESLVTDFRSSSKDQLELLGIERDLAARRASLAALERSAESERQAIQKLLLAKASCRLSDFASSIASKYSSNTLSPNSTPSSPNSAHNSTPSSPNSLLGVAHNSTPNSPNSLLGVAHNSTTSSPNSLLGVAHNSTPSSPNSAHNSTPSSPNSLLGVAHNSTPNSPNSLLGVAHNSTTSSPNSLLGVAHNSTPEVLCNMLATHDPLNHTSLYAKVVSQAPKQDVRDTTTKSLNNNSQQNISKKALQQNISKKRSNISQQNISTKALNNSKNDALNQPHRRSARLASKRARLVVL